MSNDCVARPPAGAAPCTLDLVEVDAAPASFALVNARIRWSDGAASEGWGRDEDLDLAHVKAAAEAVERRAYATLPAPALWASENDLADTVPCNALIRYEEHQYADPAFPFSCHSPTQTRWWLPVRAVDENAAAWVLADCVCNPRAFDSAYRSRLVTHATSSGCATGRTMADAVLRATLELVERDAFMRHWFRQEPGCPVAVDSLPAASAVRCARLVEAGCDVGVHCLTLGSHPVWLAWAQHEALHFTSVGAAAALDAEAALTTALDELETQALPRLDGLPEETMIPGRARSPADHAALYATRAAFRSADAVLRTAGSCARFSDIVGSFSITPAGFFTRLRARGHPVHWVDLSLPEAANLLAGAVRHTVRAIAPGLIPMAFGHGLMPLGMASGIRPAGRLVHPFC